MDDITRLVERYFEVWNETDPEQRAELIPVAWSKDAKYIDPMLAGNGHDGINAMVAGVQTQFPGHRFRLAGQVDHHNGRVRFGWELVAPDGNVAIVEGIDFGVIDNDGRLRSITGFIDRAPATIAAG